MRARKMIEERIDHPSSVLPNRTTRAAEFGAQLMHMAEPYGVEAIAIGSLPGGTTAFPFREWSPPLAPRVAFGLFPNVTYLFFATDADHERRYVVCDTEARRDEEISRAGPGFAFVMGVGANSRQQMGAIFFRS